MTGNSVWDSPELQAGGEYVTFTNIGDSISGTITAIRTHTFDDGKVVPQILLTTDDGDDRTLTAGQVRLKVELAEKRPEAGDHLSVTLVDVEKRAMGKTLKKFQVDVKRGTGTTTPATPDAPATPVVDPAAAAAALAALTPQQRAALGLPG